MKQTAALLLFLALACAALPPLEEMGPPASIAQPQAPPPPPIYDSLGAYEHRSRTARAVQYLGPNNCQEIAALFGKHPQAFCSTPSFPYGAFLVFESGGILVLDPDTFHAIYRRSQADQEVAP